MLVDIHRFELRAGVAVPDFLAADRRVQDTDVAFRTGFLRRTTARDGDRWVVITLWWSPEAASAAEEGSEAVRAFTACIDPASEDRASYETLD